MHSPYFATLPEPVQVHLQKCQCKDLRKMLLERRPSIRAGRLIDAATVLELSEIRNADDFAAAYRALTENPGLPPEVTTPSTPKQAPYLPKLTQYSALLGGSV
jgi:hypothetical protein